MYAEIEAQSNGVVAFPPDVDANVIRLEFSEPSAASFKIIVEVYACFGMHGKQGSSQGMI